jgi:hypothetical protein
MRRSIFNKTERWSYNCVDDHMRKMLIVNLEYINNLFDFVMAVCSALTMTLATAMVTRMTTTRTMAC